MTDPSQERSVWVNIIGVVGLLGYAATGFLYLVSGLVVPNPWLWLLWAVWLGGLYPLTRLFRGWRIWTPIIPVAAIVFWFLFTSVGGSVFDWTA